VSANIKVSIRLKDLDALRADAECSRCQHVPVLEQEVAELKRKLKEAEERVAKELSGGCVQIQHDLADLRLKFNAADLRANEMTSAYHDEQEARKKAEADCKRAYEDLRNVCAELRYLHIEKINAAKERDRALNGQIAVADVRTSDLETRLQLALECIREIHRVVDDDLSTLVVKLNSIRSIIDDYGKLNPIESKNPLEMLGTMKADPVSVIVPTAEPVKDGISADEAKIMKQKKCTDRSPAS